MAKEPDEKQRLTAMFEAEAARREAAFREEGERRARELSEDFQARVEAGLIDSEKLQKYFDIQKPKLERFMAQRRPSDRLKDDNMRPPFALVQKILPHMDAPFGLHGAPQAGASLPRFPGQAPLSSVSVIAPFYDAKSSSSATHQPLHRGMASASDALLPGYPVAFFDLAAANWASPSQPIGTVSAQGSASFVFRIPKEYFRPAMRQVRISPYVEILGEAKLAGYTLLPYTCHGVAAVSMSTTVADKNRTLVSTPGPVIRHEVVSGIASLSIAKSGHVQEHEVVFFGDGIDDVYIDVQFWVLCYVDVSSAACVVDFADPSLGWCISVPRVDVADV
ncbi:MAG: hypothetical protein JSV79_08915 [Armatimonadota bacterium]|nr:MAG: hypothetical protein JSV79_08915 [Armatimonadota bacterium]